MNDPDRHLPDELKLGFAHLHLNSAAFQEAYPENVQSDFKVKTNHIPLEGDWLMSMSSFTYPNMFVNVDTPSEEEKAKFLNLLKEL